MGTIDEKTILIHLQPNSGDSGKVEDMEAHTTDSVTMVKQKISEARGIPIDKINLMYNSQTLNDSDTLALRGIDNGATLQYSS